MKKFLTVTLKVIAAIAVVIALFLATTTIVNAVATSNEAGKIAPYGERVDVDGKKMNVTITGEGDQTIVLLPGFGTPAPTLDFEPLITRLNDHFRVVAVDPLGTGLSDQADTPRTSANIAAEVHEALQSLEIDRFILMGHSIAGIYGLAYVDAYPEEVTAFVGVDTSLPGQAGMDVDFPTGAFAAARVLGLQRLLVATGSDQYEGLEYSAETREQIGYLNMRNAMAGSYLDEMSHIGSNFAEAREMTFPAELPVLLFAQETNPGQPDWVELHREQAAHSQRGKLVLIDADHYLHNTDSDTIARDTVEFFAEADPRP